MTVNMLSKVFTVLVTVAQCSVGDKLDVASRTWLVAEVGQRIDKPASDLENDNAGPLLMTVTRNDRLKVWLTVWPSLTVTVIVACPKALG